MASKEGNPYFNDLFDSFDTYVSNACTLGKDTTLGTNGNVKNDKLSKFTEGLNGNSAFINIAGNYKYSCIVPVSANQPPNYIGVMKENNTLSGSFIDELFSFTESAEQNRAGINCTRAAEHLYTKAYRTGVNVETPQAYCINFTDGMPYGIYEPALREVHKDITKQLNSIIDYAIATGQTASSEEYDNILVNNFLNIFFDKDGKPRYYALRTGILPSAIAYSRCLQDDGNADSFPTHYADFETEMDYLKKGWHFIPIGQGSQFLDNAEDGARLFWYPFNSKAPYSYKYITSDGKKDMERYEVVKGFNHYLIEGNEELSSSFMTLINSTAMQTEGINNALSGPFRTVLSYRSCLSDIPAPHTITVTDTYNTVQTTKVGNEMKTCINGNATGVIEKIESWANVYKDGQFSMHPLLNRSGLKKEFLKVEAQMRPVTITEENMFTTANTGLEELYYYNNSFKIQPEKRALDRMNFYSTNDNDKSVDPYALEFGVVSRDLYEVVNGENQLTLNKEQTVKDSTFGVLGKLPDSNSTWKTFACGVTGVVNDVKAFEDTDNYLFSVKTLSGAKDVDSVKMDITTIHYGRGYGGEGDKDHGCNFYRDDKFAGGYDCHEVHYIETGTDYHERNYNKDPPGQDFSENDTVTVKFEPSEALRGDYNQSTVYNMCNMTLNAAAIQGYYYTVHILAEDGKINARVGINPSNGMCGLTDGVDNNELTKDTRTARYGTGLQYFFGGNCDKAIFESYYNRGLTLYQLLDPTTDAYSTGKGRLYGRVINGVQYANRTFEWDYDVVLKAWNLALWIMRGMPGNIDDRLKYDKIPMDALYKTEDSAIALAAFFDYIYDTNKISLMIGPSLKQINNAVGPYGSNTGEDDTGKSKNGLINKYGKKGLSTGNSKEYDNTTLRGASWDVIKDKKGTGRKVYDSLTDHAKVAAAVFVNKDTALHKDSKNKIGKNGVGKNYWSKGYTEGTKYNDDSIRSRWGEHMADARKTWSHSEGYLHLDHYSWDWHIDNNIGGDLTDPKGNNLWHGAFMIHALNPTITKDNPKGTNGKGYNSPFNWHLGPFHEVSPEAKEHTNEYGVRNKVAKWGGSGKSDGGCDTNAPDTTWKQAWDGINNDEDHDWTWDNQNPNIRIRLPMLWRYLKSLREKGIYTDGQLMPCGIELHYCNYRKSLMTSITNVEHTIPISTGLIEAKDKQPLSVAEDEHNRKITDMNMSNWRNAIESPSSITFAEVLYDTHAITKNTISKWYKSLTDPKYYTPLIRDILTSVSKQADKLTAMYRTKRYINSIGERMSLNDGVTLYNIPILPAVSLFGATATKNGNIDDSIVMRSDMKMTYNVAPSFNLTDATCSNVAVGVTYPPVLQDGQEANQFSAIASSIYANMASFKANTIGWIIPIPTKANLALLNAYDGSWRKNNASVIPLTTDNVYKLLGDLNESKVHWIGWVNSDNLNCISANDLSGLVHICYDKSSPSSSIGADVAVVPMVSLKITPYYNNLTDCNTDGISCSQSEKTKEICNDATPFSVKFEIDTRGMNDSVKLIMIRDKIEDDVEYSIYNLSTEVPVGGQTLISYMTTVSYDKDNIELPSVLRPL